MKTAKKTAKKKPATKRQPVLVRTYSAGVHAGYLVRRDGREVELADAVRVWRWRGPVTLSEMSQSGVRSATDSGYTRVSVAVPSITLTEAIEIIPMAAAAWDSVRTAGWAP